LGMAVDHVRQFDIVVPASHDHPEARRILANKHQHKDLFWALRGCNCQNWGLVEAVHYRLPSISNRIIMFSISFDWDKAKNVLETWFREAPKHSKYFNEDLSLIQTQTEEECSKRKIIRHVELGGLYVIPLNQSFEEAVEIVAREQKDLIDLSTKFIWKLTTYANSMIALANARRYFEFSKPLALFNKRALSSCQIDAILQLFDEAKTNPNIVGVLIAGFELMGGAISEKTPKSTAFYARQSQFFCESVVNWSNARYNCGNIQFAEELYGKLRHPGNTLSSFYGFPINFVKDPNFTYWNRNGRRLARIKRKYDPFKVLEFPQCVQS